MITIPAARPLAPLPLAALMLVAGCSQPPATTANGNGASLGGGASETVTPAIANGAPIATPTPVETPAVDQAAYLGRWVGVEGMYLNVTAKPGGGLSLDMQYDLDHHGIYDGSVTAEGLRFIRNGVAETAVRTDGDATGLKWLEGKADCLTVKQGEGYCRA